MSKASPPRHPARHGKAIVLLPLIHMARHALFKALVKARQGSVFLHCRCLVALFAR